MIRIIQSDITALDVNAIVNAANNMKAFDNKFETIIACVLSQDDFKRYQSMLLLVSYL